MTESLEARLKRAGRIDVTDAATTSALSAVVHDARAASGRRRPRRWWPAIALGSVLALAAPVAVAATQWGPWAMPDPDLIVARDWFYVDGTPVGSCESRMSIEELPDDIQREAVAYFDALDVDSMEPDPEAVAIGLVSLGRLDDVGELIAGAEPSDFDINHQGGLADPAILTDARILQESLMSRVSSQLAMQLISDHPDEFSNGFESAVETQCTTAPGAQP